MVETKEDAAAAATTTDKPTTTTDKPRKRIIAKKSKAKDPLKKLNQQSLGTGVYKYGKKKKRNVWTFVGKRTPRKKRTVKPVDGEKAGEKPVDGTKKDVKRPPPVYVRGRRHVKYPRFYPTMDKYHKHRRPAKNPKMKLRASLVPGKVVILLAGVHKGRRVIFLKQLKSGLLLVTGPLYYNSVPLRRVHPMYVLATSTKLDISNVEIPSNIDDAYFKRVKPKMPNKKKDGDIFAVKKQKYKVSQQRKLDQKVVDKQLLAIIKKVKDRKLFEKYLRAPFGLKNRMYPHRMKF